MVILDDLGAANVAEVHLDDVDKVDIGVEAIGVPDGVVAVGVGDKGIDAGLNIGLNK